MSNTNPGFTPPSKGQTKLFEIPIVATLYQAYTTFHNYSLKFPKSQRYSLGQDINQQILAIIELTLAAAATGEPNDKLTSLQAASAKLDLLRLLIRLAKDTKCLDNQAYLNLESQLHEVGRMLGGWLKSLT